MYTLEPLIERVEVYAKSSYNLYKLKTIEKIANLISSFVFRGIVAIFFSIFTLIANIGISFWLGDLLGKSYYGFICVAGFNLLIGGIIYLFMRKYIKKRVMNSIISQLLN